MRPARPADTGRPGIYLERRTRTAEQQERRAELSLVAKDEGATGGRPPAPGGRGAPVGTLRRVHKSWRRRVREVQISPGDRGKLEARVASGCSGRGQGPLTSHCPERCDVLLTARSPELRVVRGRAPWAARTRARGGSGFPRRALTLMCELSPCSSLSCRPLPPGPLQGVVGKQRGVAVCVRARAHGLL